MTFLGEPISGLIGAATGVLALAVSIIAYRRSNELKKSELRLSLQMAINGAQSEGTKLLDILEKAFPSRMSVLNLMGRLNSGVSHTFEAQHQEDSNRAVELTQQLSSEVEKKDYDAMSLRELEKEILWIDKIARKIDHLIDRYKKSLEEDDKYLPRS